MFSNSDLLAALAVAACVSFGPAAEPEPRAKGRPNRLAKEDSAYLLQHAHNPVDWYPWGRRRSRRPAGRASSFSSPSATVRATGATSWSGSRSRTRRSPRCSNANFVCVKVDREERPDVDEVYMTALTVTGESGGWPLSMFLTPDGKPMFGATYIPPKDRDVSGGKVLGFDSVLKKVLRAPQEQAQGNLRPGRP